MQQILQASELQASERNILQSLVLYSQSEWQLLETCMENLNKRLIEQLA